MQSWQAAQAKGTTPAATAGGLTLVNGNWVRNAPASTGGGLNYNPLFQSAPQAASAAPSTPMPQLSQFQTSAGGNPQVTQQIQLSPQEQQLLNQTQQQQLAESNIATGLEGEVANSLNTPVATSADFNAEAQKAADAYYNSQMGYLQPSEATAREQLDSQLANQGVAPGSDAYKTAQDQLDRNDTFQNQQAQDNAILNGTQNAQQLFSLTTAAQEQPLNEYSALMSGSQASMPSFGSVNPVQAQPTNVSQLYQNQYAGQQDAYNQGIASNNATTSGLFGLGGTSLSGLAQGIGNAGGLNNFFSDVRLKENISHAGYEKGFPIYHFSYRSDPSRAMYRGVMAQEVMQTRPDAVVSDGEYLAVDYGKLGIGFGRVQ